MNAPIDFDAINRAASPMLPALLREWLPDGRLQGDEWVARNPTRADRRLGSFKVNVTSGRWSDFATGDAGGDVISLVACLEQQSQVNAARRLAARLGLGASAPARADDGRPSAIGGSAGGEDRPLLPVPADAPPPPFRHGKLGTPTARWAYRDGDGRLLGYIARFDIEAGRKQILPLTFCALAKGGTGWRWKAFPAPRPLYGLDRLAARPDAPVLIVEGEKTCDAAASLLPDYVVVSWPGGSKAVGRADWSALSGRTITIWPDHDAPGLSAAAAVAEAVMAAGAAGARVVQLPDDLPAGWDLADEPPEGLDMSAVLQTTAVPLQASLKLPTGFHFTPQGLMWHDPTDDEKLPIWVAGPLDVLAETRDAEGQSWGVLLRWFDNDGREHRLPLSRAMLAGDGADARRILIDGGYAISEWPGARAKFNSFLLRVQSPNRARACRRPAGTARCSCFPTPASAPPAAISICCNR